jgi:hypothetical protein
MKQRLYNTDDEDNNKLHWWSWPGTMEEDYNELYKHLYA